MRAEASAAFVNSQRLSFATQVRKLLHKLRDMLFHDGKYCHLQTGDLRHNNERQRYIVIRYARFLEQKYEKISGQQTSAWTSR